MRLIFFVDKSILMITGLMSIGKSVSMTSLGCFDFFSNGYLISLLTFLILVDGLGLVYIADLPNMQVPVGIARC